MTSPADDNWIPIPGEKLPPPLEDVLITHYTFGEDSPSVDIAYRRHDGRWIYAHTDDLFCHPIAWQPLPAAFRPASRDEAAA